MRHELKIGAWVCGTLIGIGISAGLAPALAGDWVTQVRARWQNHKGVPSAEALAVEIDKLEKHIDAYGTIVAKQPDVWGQARLMRHRDEFEKQLHDELGKFNDSIQGTISRSDQAFLASAFSLSAAVSGAPAVQLPQSTAVSREIATRQRGALRSAGVANPTPEQLSNVTAPTPIAIPSKNDAAGLVDDFDKDKVIQRSDIKTSATSLGFGATALSVEPTERADQLARFVNHVHEIRRINEGDDTSASPGYAMHLVRIPVSILPGNRTRKGFGAEITVTASPHLGRDLLPTTFRNLVVNDLVGQIAAPLTEFFNSEVSRDAFAIYREGKLWPEQDALSTRPVPTPFFRSPTEPPPAPESGQPLDTKPKPPSDAIPEAIPDQGARRVSRPATVGSPRPRSVADRPTARVDRSLSRTASELGLPLLPGTILAQTCLASTGQGSSAGDLSRGLLARRKSEAILRTTSPRFAEQRAAVAAMGVDLDGINQATISRITTAAAGVVQQSFQTLGANSVPALRSRNARFSFPTTQLWEVYGEELVKPVALQAFDVLLGSTLGDDDVPKLVQYHKVAGYVQDQVTAAYEFLSRPESLPIWSQFATPDLARAIQERDVIALRAIRTAFLEALPNQGIDRQGPYRDLHTNYRLRLLPNGGNLNELTGGERDLVVVAVIDNKLHFRIYDADGRVIVDQDQESLGDAAAPKIGGLRNRLIPFWNVDDLTLSDTESFLLDITAIVGATRLYSTTATFAWAILVESVLLNEQLIDDMREVASAKGTALGTEPQPYFLPCPPEAARTAFNDYVRVRFPIHVFALDPFVQEQNIADQLARSRELQLALSLAFVTGRINASSMTRFARRLELNTSTIALNRTQFAFSHGEDTFGWRFQPRYQTPPTQNNLAVLSQTLGGGPTRDGDIRQLAIEPGPRECVAILLIPSFVPYADFETRTNWYRLTHPKHTEIDPLKFLELSASIRRASQLAAAVCDAGLYRDGDIARLVNRVRQLAAELPLQSLQTQLPYENTHGGFELFNVGITDLAPTLRSWYGIPGVDPNNENLVFLIGDNFSVVSTSVVAGNRAADPTGNRVNLLSKQVLSVTIPAGVQTVRHGGIECVELSIATPYGVSQPLYIPTYKPGSSRVPPLADLKPSNLRWTPDTIRLAFENGAIAIEPPDGKETRFQRLPTKRLLVALDGPAQLDGTTANFRLVFDPLDDRHPGDSTPTPISIPEVKYVVVEKAYVVEGDKYDAFIANLYDSFNEANYKDILDRGDLAPEKLIGAAHTTVTITGGAAGLKPPKETANLLKVRWVLSKDKDKAKPTSTIKDTKVSAEGNETVRQTESTREKETTREQETIKKPEPR